MLWIISIAISGRHAEAAIFDPFFSAMAMEVSDPNGPLPFERAICQPWKGAGSLSKEELPGFEMPSLIYHEKRFPNSGNYPAEVPKQIARLCHQGSEADGKSSLPVPRRFVPDPHQGGQTRIYDHERQ